MKKKKTNLRRFLLAVCCLAAMTAFMGCSDDSKGDDDTTGILRPIAENVIGKWNMEESYKKQDGKWVEDIIPEGEGHTYTIRTDGTALSAFTAPDGYTKLNVGKWSTDEAADKLTLGTMTVDVLSLNATSFEMGHDEARDSETGEIMEGEFKWKFSRMDETVKTLAEKLVGKWNFSKSYEKKDGEWVEISYGLPDEGWHLYREDGTYTAYSRSGENEMTIDMTWVVNNTTGAVRWTGKDGQTSSVNVSVGTDGTLSVFYSNNFDPSTGQVVTGEFKDVLVRE